MALLLRLRRAGGLDEQPAQELKRCLRLPDLLFFGFSSVVGAGIFVTVGVAGREAGPGLVAAFGLAGLCCLPTALCYSELATRFPCAGSIYSFVARALGDYFAFVVGVSLIIDGTISSAAIAKACTSYFAQVLLSIGVRLPVALVSVKVSHAIAISLMAPGFVAAMGYTAYRGVETMATFNKVLTIANMLLILVVILFGATLVEADNYDPLLPHGLPGIERAAALTFFAMLGFDAATSLAEETLEPERVLPRAILCTVAGTTLLYMVISMIFCGLVTVDEIDETAPLAHAFRARGAPVLAFTIAVGAVGNTSTSLLGNLTRLPRFVLRMASDGHLPKRLAAVDPRTQGPTRALGASLVVAMLMAGVVSFAALVQMASVGALIGFSLINASVLLVRCRPASQRQLATATATPAAAASAEEGKGNEGEPLPSVLGTTGPYLGLTGASDDGPGGSQPVAMPEGEEGEAVEFQSRWQEPTYDVVRLASLLLAYFASSLVLNFSITLGSHPALVLLFAFCTALAAGGSARCYQESAEQTGEEEASHTFLTPCMPWVPLLAIVFNNFIIANLPVLALVRFMCVEAGLGSCVYFARLGRRSVPLRLRRLRKPHARRRLSPNAAAINRAYAEFDLNDDVGDACQTPRDRDRAGLEPASPTNLSPSGAAAELRPPVFAGPPLMAGEDPEGACGGSGAGGASPGAGPPLGRASFEVGDGGDAL